MFLSNLFGKKEKTLTREEVIELLKIQPELLTQFENAYKPFLEEESEDFFKVNAKQASAKNKEMKISYEGKGLDTIVQRIVDELMHEVNQSKEKIKYLSASEVNTLPEEIRPSLTGQLMKKDINANSYEMILYNYQQFLKTGEPIFYHAFRQGLDILDLDKITYEIIGTNPNSMGYWFPKLKAAIDQKGFFKYPETKIVKIPLPLLQLTRQEYSELTPSTIRVLNEFCMKAFELDVNKEYFIKTGTYSSKFDFRNARVYGEKEVREIGEYLLYIHFQALQMASPLSSPSIYGVSTTNEWVVREFIEDVEDNPTIYMGMPLRTEYRFFVDFDTKEVIGVSPYWRKDVMERSLKMFPNDPYKKHDYVVYKVHEDKLYEKYNANVDGLTSKVNELIQNVDLKGQWSLDIMQNGDDFYAIDMAEASSSALSDCVPANILKKNEENWIPKLSQKQID